jgi:hypothetical protein
MTRNRFFATAVKVYAALAALWIVYLVYLDVTQAMFPRVLFGGIKILVVVTLVVGGAAFAVSALSSRLRRRAPAPMLHGSPAE